MKNFQNFKYQRGTKGRNETVGFDIVGDTNTITCEVDAYRLIIGIRRHPCSNGENLELSDEAAIEVLEFLKKERDFIKHSDASQPKTLQGWRDSGLDLSDYVPVGREVDEAIVDEMMNCVPPHRMMGGYLQVGEPYADALDERSQPAKYRPTYATFHKMSKDGNYVWIYAGHCFSGDNVNHMPERDTAGRVLNELKNKLSNN